MEMAEFYGDVNVARFPGFRESLSALDHKIAGRSYSSTSGRSYQRSAGPKIYCSILQQQRLKDNKFSSDTLKATQPDSRGRMHQSSSNRKSHPALIPAHLRGLKLGLCALVRSDKRYLEGTSKMAVPTQWLNVDGAHQKNCEEYISAGLSTHPTHPVKFCRCARRPQGTGIPPPSYVSARCTSRIYTTRVCEAVVAANVAVKCVPTCCVAKLRSTSASQELGSGATSPTLARKLPRYFPSAPTPGGS